MSILNVNQFASFKMYSIGLYALYKLQKKKSNIWIWHTSANATPRTEFPHLSSGGDHKHSPQTLGTTRTKPPLTPDLAGSPT